MDRLEQATERLRLAPSNANNAAVLEAHRDSLRYVWMDAPWWDRWLGLSQWRLNKLTERYYAVASELWRTRYE